MSKVKIKRALISVSDKAGLIPFAKTLRKNGIEIISTGGTLKALQKAKVKAIAIDAVTDFPEMLDGRVKTLHPKIHGGLLYRRDKKSHRDQVKEHDIDAIDLVVVNLYPFEKAAAGKDVKLPDAIELIDIGGPSMLRSAAKNCDAVTVVTDVEDYTKVVEELKAYDGKTSKELRFDLACKVFEKTAAYDAMIFKKLRSYQKTKDEGMPESVSLNFKKDADLRYGENPHQKAAVYVPASGVAQPGWRQLHGKQLSFNNLMDMEATLDIVSEFVAPAACVVKHTNPCGAAQNKDLATAMNDAIDSDPLSAFGGIVGLNRKCDSKTAKVLLSKLGFFEIIAAPAFDAGALRQLKKRKNLRVIEVLDLADHHAYDVRLLRSGAIIQEKNAPLAGRMKQFEKQVKFVTKKKLTGKAIKDLIFAYQCAKVVKSNAIVLTQGSKTVGVGAGQMSRVDSVRIACDKAGDRTKGSYLGSDAFFPMPDAIETAAEHGIQAIIQPGGSIRDKDVIAACNQFGIAMACVGERHFKH